LVGFFKALLELADTRFVAVFDGFNFFSDFLISASSAANANAGTTKTVATAAARMFFLNMNASPHDNQYGAARFRRGRIRIALLEENGRGAAVERGNLARTEEITRTDRLLEDRNERKDRRGGAGHRVTNFSKLTHLPHSWSGQVVPSPAAACPCG